MSDNVQEKIVDLLNQASMYGTDSTRVQHLRHLQELIVRKNPNLLTQFLEEVLNFQTDKSPEVKKTIISFIEETCQHNPQLILKIIDSINLFLCDDNIFVRKRIILSMISIYKSILTWLSKFELLDENICHIWAMLTNIKTHIISMLNSDDERLCTVVIKFIEMLALTLSRYEQQFSMNLISNDNKIICKAKLEDEEKEMMEKLIDFSISKTLSSVNLIAAVEAITNIARQKFDYISRVVHTFEVLHAKLPSKFTDSQISTVHKTLKLKLLNLLKYSASFNIQSQITTLLTNFGATQTEILKNSHKVIQEPKRKLISNHNAESTKKSKTMNHVKQHNHDDLKDEISNIIEVQHNYSSLKISSTVEHKTCSISTNTNTSMSTELIRNSNNQEKKIKSFKLSNTMKPFEFDQMQRMSLDSFHRLIDAQDICERSGVDDIRQKMLTLLVCLFDQSFHHIYEEHIFADIHQRYDLAFKWLYQEYIYANGYLTTSNLNRTKDFTKYDKILCRLLTYLQEKDEDLYSRLIMSAPLLTDNSLSTLNQYCQNEDSSCRAINILCNLILQRVIIRGKCLNLLLNLTHHENVTVRNHSLNIIKYLYEKIEYKQAIEEYSLKFLLYLRDSKPPEALFDDIKQSSTISKDIWTDDSIRLCLTLYFSLMSSNHYLIQLLANLFTEVNKDKKRVILHALETPILEIGAKSSELLKLVKNCPHGAEALIARMIHILTQQMPPSQEIVKYIRDLYYERISDVRLLIPVLVGLEKHEIINTIPKFIKLSPPVVKEVFHQLLGSNVSSSNTCLLSPSELLIALHRISIEECELRTIINATSICFNQRSIYTPDVLAIVLQQLLEMNPLPILFMRTVLQTLNFYPKMVTFMMNILQRLITKQVWKQTRIWDGFIKCCEKTRPYSYPILLQLPPPQLQYVLHLKSELRDGLLSYLRSLTSIQRSSIPPSLLILFEGDLENIMIFSPSETT